MHTLLRSITVLFLTLTLGLAPLSASAASSGTADITGATVGKIKGSGGKNGLRVVAFSHQVSSGTKKGGKSNGARAHRFVELTVEVDQAMPMLMSAWASNELISRVQITLVGSRGKYIVELRDAHIAEATLASTVGSGDQSSDHLVLKLDYGKISWRHGAVEGEDSW